jgi:hypothetical protein
VGEHLARMGENRTACMLLLGQPEGRRLLGGPRCGWVDNIKMDRVESAYSQIKKTDRPKSKRLILRHQMKISRMAKK